MTNKSYAILVHNYDDENSQAYIYENKLFRNKAEAQKFM